MRPVVLAILAALVSTCCAELGYRDRVLHRIPSPTDSSLMAVCQEIPSFDGPGYDIRLERPDGNVVRRLYSIGDGDPCHEIVWSPDGRTLAVLSSHVARALVVDVEWALSRPATQTSAWSWRSVSLASDESQTLARHLRFIAPAQIEYEVCPHKFGDRNDPEGWRRCAAPPETRRLRLPPPRT